MENLTFSPMSSKVAAELAKLVSSCRLVTSGSKGSLRSKVMTAMLKGHVITNPWGHSE